MESVSVGCESSFTHVAFLNASVMVWGAIPQCHNLLLFGPVAMDCLRHGVILDARLAPEHWLFRSVSWFDPSNQQIFGS